MSDSEMLWPWHCGNILRTQNKTSIFPVQSLLFLFLNIRNYWFYDLTKSDSLPLCSFREASGFNQKLFLFHMIVFHHCMIQLSKDTKFLHQWLPCKKRLNSWCSGKSVCVWQIVWALSYINCVTLVRSSVFSSVKWASYVLVCLLQLCHDKHTMEIRSRRLSSSCGIQGIVTLSSFLLSSKYFFHPLSLHSNQ